MSTEESEYYWREVSKWVVVRGGKFHFPSFFGVPAHSRTSLPLIKADLEPRPLILRLGLLGTPLWTTDFDLHIVKEKQSCFRLTLCIGGEKLHFRTVETSLSWVEFALLMKFALMHGRVTYVSVLEVLVVEKCFGIRSFQLIH